MASLRRRVAVWLVPPMLLVLAINAALSYRGALEGANLAYDRSLRAAINAIGERSIVRDGEIVVDIPYSAFEVFDDEAQERIFYAVLDGRGNLLTGYPNLPQPRKMPADGRLGTDDATFNGEAVRTGAMRKRLYSTARDGSDSVLVVVAETTETRTELAQRLFLDGLRRQLALILSGGLLVLLALGTAFRPLLALRDRIRGRAEEDLTPLEANAVPSEISPLIGAINHHMGRLSQMLEARRRFIADAAHQLRTPLTVLGNQVEYALRQDDPQEIRRALEGMHRSIGGAQRLANQMLALSRAEAVNGLMRERAPCDMARLAREVALELAPLAMQKQIELEYLGADSVPAFEGNDAMLREMLSNLLDNAIRYTPAQGHVTLDVRDDGEAVLICVADNGPGIPPAEQDQVFRRFYRGVEQQSRDGSGLGLAIVREICLAHGGEVGLGAGLDGRGLGVTVRLPLPK